MKKRTYFRDTKLTSGEFVTVIYESASRKGTEPHWYDLCWAADDLDVDWDYERDKDTADFSFILNEKNKEEQLFGEYRVLDLR